MVGWSLREDMAREIVIDALRMAWFKRHPGKQAGLIFHGDRGSQYASQDLRDVLTEYGIKASMSRLGNCWDNACSATLFGSLKVERLHGQRFATRRRAKDETTAWLLWYNQTRLHSTLAYVSPVRTAVNARWCKPGIGWRGSRIGQRGRLGPCCCRGFRSRARLI